MTLIHQCTGFSAAIGRGEITQGVDDVFYLNKLRIDFCPWCQTIFYYEEEEEDEGIIIEED